MRNRYQRDLNRLIRHPRRMQGVRKLRSPGALNSNFSSASGLPREPAPTPGLPIYLMENGKVHRMSPDMLTVEETLYSDAQAEDFSVTDGKLLVVQRYASNDTEAIFVGQGVTISTDFGAPNYDVRPWCGANSNNFLIYFADGAGAGYMESYSLAGTYESAINIAGSDLDYTLYWPGSVPANNNSAGFQGYEISSGNFAFATANLGTGVREYLVTVPSHYEGPAFFTGSRYYYFDTLFTDLNAKISILDLSYNSVGTWQLQYGGRYYTFCVTEQFGYAFRSDPANETPFSTVEIYDRVGDTFTLLNEIDLIATHNFTRVDTAMPDMKELLATAA